VVSAAPARAPLFEKRDNCTSAVVYSFSGRRHQLGDGDGSTLALTLVPGASDAATTTPDLPRISIVFVADLYSFVPKA